MVMAKDEGAAGAAYLRAGRNRPRPKVLGPGPWAVRDTTAVGGKGEFRVSGSQSRATEGVPTKGSRDGTTSRSGRRPAT
jgi:hypothetical protein